MSKSALMPVKFHGATLILVTQDNKPYVAIKPICDALTIQWEAQLKRIRRNPVLSSTVSIMDMVAEDCKTREMVCLPLSMLNGWLFGINVNRVKNPAIREKLIAYQFECYDVLNAYWSGKTVSRQPEISRTNLTALCSHMLFLEGFWHQYGNAIRGFNRNLSASIHDHFNDGAFVALQFISMYSLDVVPSKVARNYPFGANNQEKHEYWLATKNEKR